jgi:hypothetical protein
LAGQHWFPISRLEQRHAAATSRACEGRLRLEDKVGRCFPRLVPRANEISVRHLLNDTTGISDYFRDTEFAARLSNHPQLVVPPREKIAIAASRPLIFHPGTNRSDSSTNYIVLGLIIEKGTPVVVDCDDVDATSAQRPDRREPIPVFTRTYDRKSRPLADVAHVRSLTR